MKKKDVTKSGNNGNVSRGEFNELKEMFAEVLFEIRRIGNEQEKMGEELKKMGEEQKRMGEELKKMGEELKKMGEEQKKMGEEQKRMGNDITSIRREVGGLSRSVSYALENEAYRELPKFLKTKYGIEILTSLIRTEIRKDCEINILGEGTRHGKPVLIVGEAKLKLQGYYTTGTSDNLQMADVFDQLESNVETVRIQCKHVKESTSNGSTKEIVRILITHFATADFLEEAAKRGVIVVQSYEWQAY
ncbi:MAG: hypothetical protein HQL04_00365 [Nitrospirae bacterium]|nr:hypothetical protein [Nitrospirota bacterium]